MDKRSTYTAEQFIKAIPGTGGNISQISSNVGCVWDTAKKFIETHPSVKAAYEAECEAINDLCESLITVNVRLARKKQAETLEPVDTGDAKWWLARKGKNRGFSERIEQTGADGERLISVIEIVKDYGGGSDGTA